MGEIAAIFPADFGEPRPNAGVENPLGSKPCSYRVIMITGVRGENHGLLEGCSLS